MQTNRLFFRFLFILTWLLSGAGLQAQTLTTWDAAQSSAVAGRQRGNTELSIGLFVQAGKLASTDLEKMRTAGELGATLLLARRLDQAQASLQEAYNFFTGPERARYALDLGNLATLRKRQTDAVRFYEEARQLAGDDTEVYASAALNLARLVSEPWRSQKLAAIFEIISFVTDSARQIPLYLNLGNQARTLGQTALAYKSLYQAQQLAEQTSTNRMTVESQDAMAQLYEDEGRQNDSLTLTQQAIAVANTLAPSAVADLLIALEWRQGRIYRALGQAELALAAFERAVTQIESIRLDIPIEYDDGRSSFHATLEPVYMGLVDLLIKASAQKTAGDGQAYLRRAINTVELIKQSELQDYLGDRCTLDVVKGGASGLLPPNTAALYPVIFEDRVELLLETTDGLARQSVSVSGAQLRTTARRFADALRNALDYQADSRQLYDWLLRPFDGVMADKHIDTLVVVPDGALRLVAIGALHDGSRFAIEKYAITTATGLSMTNTAAPPAQAVESLMAGVSEFGPVVDKLNQARVKQMAELASDRGLHGATEGIGLRSIRTSNSATQPSAQKDASSRVAALREALALPGVKREIEAISVILPGTHLLNAAFTLDGFRAQAESGSYRMLHIASHGIFGGSADTSYILAYDDFLTLDRLQSLLKSDQFRKNPIELLSLSACETAQGNDRAPLGIAGAASKARAKSVLGTLWPVDDDAARKIMESFYGGLITSHLTKAQSLRKGQIELIRQKDFAHPFYWAPFVLIGNWL